MPVLESLLQLRQGDTCSIITHPDFPRQYDIPCNLRALAICEHPGCEATLCALHTETCSVCGKEFCTDCLELHAVAQHRCKRYFALVIEGDDSLGGLTASTTLGNAVRELSLPPGCRVTRSIEITERMAKETW